MPAWRAGEAIWITSRFRDCGSQDWKILVNVWQFNWLSYIGLFFSGSPCLDAVTQSMAMTYINHQWEKKAMPCPWRSWADFVMGRTFFFILVLALSAVHIVGIGNWPAGFLSHQHLNVGMSPLTQRFLQRSVCGGRRVTCLFWTKDPQAFCNGCSCDYLGTVFPDLQWSL